MESLITGEFPHKGPVTRKMFPFDDVIMIMGSLALWSYGIRGKLLQVSQE